MARTGTGFNKLYQWLRDVPPGTLVIGGSAAPARSMNEIIGLSTDPEATRAALSFNDVQLGVGSSQGNEALRQAIVDTYDKTLSGLNVDNITINNATTGSNHIVLQSLLKPGDHIICQYPMYGAIIEEAMSIGCELSYLTLDPKDNWRPCVSQLPGLIRPGKTKLIALNNPVNPTGTQLDTSFQQEVIALCKKHDIAILCDEIFRPLFYGDEHPTSLIEHKDLEYDKIVVTSSLSKAYGLGGVRIGWTATRSEVLQAQIAAYRTISCVSVSAIDELIATEVLGPRCRTAFLEQTRALAHTNIKLLQKFIDERSNICEWVAPTAGADGFLQFKDPTAGEPVDDVAFCKKLLKSKKALLTPASYCFEYGGLEAACAGRVRIHFTTQTDNLEKGLALLAEFLDEEAREKQPAKL